MPSIPQSLLWISLVVLWLFVLVPMLISKRDAVRRTSDVALATRVLNSGPSARKLKRGAPAAGHRSDPDWQPSEESDEDALQDADETPARAVVVASKERRAGRVKRADPEYLDVDVVELDSGALPIGSVEAVEAEDEVLVGVEDADEPTDTEAIETVVREDVVAAAQAVESPPTEPIRAQEKESAPVNKPVDKPVDKPGEEPRDEPEDTYEDDDEVEEVASRAEPANDRPAMSSNAARRRQNDSKTAAAVSARKYRFRMRVLVAMAVVVLGTTVGTFTVWPDGWWACGLSTGVMVLYLAYLRRQTRIEERLRRRRMQRMARSRAGVVNAGDRPYDMPSRVRRPGATVLEVDDEDPIFEHLDYAPGHMAYQMPRAAG